MHVLLWLSEWCPDDKHLRTKSAENNIHRTASATSKNHLACYQNTDWYGSLQIPPQTIPLFWKVVATRRQLRLQKEKMSCKMLVIRTPFR